MRAPVDLDIALRNAANEVRLGMSPPLVIVKRHGRFSGTDMLRIWIPQIIQDALEDLFDTAHQGTYSFGLSTKGSDRRRP